MIKVYKQKAMKYNGLTYRARDVIADELYLDRLTKVPEAIVVSSWRSLAEQKLMVANGKSKTLTSNHRRGMACDIVNWKELQEKLRKVGLMNDISWDRNHFAYDSEAKATRFPIIDALPKKLEEYKTSSKPKVKDIPSKIVSTLTDTKSDINVPQDPLQSVEQGTDNQINDNNMQVANSFDKETVVKISKGALIAGSGAILTYFAQYVTSTDFGAYTPMVVAVASIIINAGREFLKGI